MASSWKSTKKSKETHFLRGHMLSGNSNNSSSANSTDAPTGAANGTASNAMTPSSSGDSAAAAERSSSSASASPHPASAPGCTPAFSSAHAAADPPASDQEARHAASLGTLVGGSRSNTITASSRGTITTKSSSHAAPPAASKAAAAASQKGSGGAGSHPAAHSSHNAHTSSSHASHASSSSASSASHANSGVARNAAGSSRVKVYESRHSHVQQHRSVSPAWAFEKSSTKPPPVYIVLEYDKTQISSHAIGGTVEDPVWDKTTAFDVVSGGVPSNVSSYSRTRAPFDDKKHSGESDRRSVTADDAGSTSHHHHAGAAGSSGHGHAHGSDSISDSHSDFQPSSVTSNATTATTSSSSSTGKRSGSNADATNNNSTSHDTTKSNTANAVKEAEESRIRDISLATTKIEPASFNSQEQLGLAGGVSSIKCESHNTRNQSSSIDDFTLMKVIGKGSFGKVMQVRKNDTRQVYALKTIRKAHIVSKSEVGHTLAERTVLAKINNPFIVPSKFSFQSPEKLYLVLAFVNGGESFHHSQREGRFDSNRARFYTAESLCALECLHEYNVIYRDLKPENISLDYTGHIALCDFGLCKLNMGSKDQTSTFCGTPEYLAPESSLGQGYTKAVDWWTLGVSFYEMLTGSPPFYDQNTNTMYHKIVKDPLTFPADMDREAKSSISSSLDRDPTRRLGANGAVEIKAHPFFHQIDWKYSLNKKYAAPFSPSVASAVDTSNFDSEFTSEVPMDSVVDKQFYLSESVQQQFGGWSYSTESRSASSGKW